MFGLLMTIIIGFIVGAFVLLWIYQKFQSRGAAA